MPIPSPDEAYFDEVNAHDGSDRTTPIARRARVANWSLISVAERIRHRQVHSEHSVLSHFATADEPISRKASWQCS